MAQKRVVSIMRGHGNHFTLDVPAHAGMARTVGTDAIQVLAIAEKVAIGRNNQWPLGLHA
jgi:hypothetical protein